VANKILTRSLAEPLDNTKSAKIESNSGTGHLSVSPIMNNEPLLAKGTLQYLEKQGVPSQFMSINDGQAVLVVEAGEIKQSGFHFPPWAGCGGAYEWQIQLNPTVPCDINVKSRGGNVKLNLAGMNITNLAAESGGGNMDVVLPDNVTDLAATIKTGGGNINVKYGSGLKGNNTIKAESGAGNVVLRLPDDVATKIHAHTGMGKVIVDPSFNKIDKDTYQSGDYDHAEVKIEVTARSGAGNVVINTK
jgi:hypothetical protein